MGQNATERATRAAVLASPLRDFEAYRLTLNCGTTECGGERTYAVAELARMHGGGRTISAVLLRLRCRLCGERPRTCFIETGPEMSRRGGARRMALIVG